MPYKELTTTPEQSRNKNTMVSTVPGNAKTLTQIFKQCLYWHSRSTLTMIWFQTMLELSHSETANLLTMQWFQILEIATEWLYKLAYHVKVWSIIMLELSHTENTNIQHYDSKWWYMLYAWVFPVHASHVVNKVRKTSTSNPVFLQLESCTYSDSTNMDYINV